MSPSRPELIGTRGMIASTHWLASAVGMSVLEHGGNAFDAAVAAGFTLQVVEPHLNGPAGEAPMLVSVASSPDVEVIAGQGCAPRAATAEHFASLGLDFIPGSGLLPACVPAAFDAWLTLLERYGTWPLADVLGPAIGYAQYGYPVLPTVSHAISTVAELFATHWRSSAAVYLPGGAVPSPGSRLRNPALADTYARIAALSCAATSREAGIAAARAAFYQGFVAEEIDEFVRRPAFDATGRSHAGLITGQDLAAWQTSVEAPTTFDFGEYRVCKTAPWGQGPVFLQQLALIASLDRCDLGPSDADLVHVAAECTKLAFADREAYYGDPAFVDVPLGPLLSAEYAAQRRALLGSSASRELRPGSPDGRAPRMPSLRRGAANIPAEVGVGEPTMQSAVELNVDVRGVARGDTCYLSVVDAAGNMVSVTPSGGWLQSSPVIAPLGFGLGTRAQMFWLEPDLPNSLAPGKRPRTTLSPTIALRDGHAYIAFGTPGGDQQDQWQFGFFLRHALFGMSLQESIEAPLWHSTHFPSSFYPRDAHPGQLIVEARLGEATIAELRRRGHEVVVSGEWALGRLNAVSRGADGFLRAAADPRGNQAYAAGR